MSNEIESGATFVPTGFAKRPVVVTAGVGDTWSLSGPHGGISSTRESIVAVVSDRARYRRVPPGYIIPSLADWLDATARLYAARNAMLADPETGTKGADDCICEMARLAGIEVAVMSAIVWTEVASGRFESSKVGVWHGVARNVGYGERPWRAEIHSDAKDIRVYRAAYATSDSAIDACETMLKSKSTS